MDRVLIVTDEVIFSSHIEKTLREVGFEVAIHSTEIGLQQAIVNFRPEVIVVKGTSAKLSSLLVGQILKEVINYQGKVILIMNKNQNIDPNDINRVKMDYLLFEPVGAVKVVSHVLALIPEQRDIIRSRLQKLTESDTNFRNKEEMLTVSGNKASDQDTVHISGKSVAAEKETIHVAGKAEAEKELVHVTGKIEGDNELNHVKSTEPLSPTELQHIKSKLEKDLAENGSLNAKKIEAYNKAIGNLDVDLKKGLNKRQTNVKQKALRKELLVDPGQEKLDSLDEDRRRFATALMKKK